jgi:hypothetical protein
MNNLLNALEELDEVLTSAESQNRALRVRSILIELLHKDELELDQSDPNHPYSRFAKPNDVEGNRLRLFQAVEEKIDEETGDLQACVNLMFEVPGTSANMAVTTLLRRYLRYANEHRSSDSDSGSDSDSS